MFIIVRGVLVKELYLKQERNLFDERIVGIKEKSFVTGKINSRFVKIFFTKQYLFYSFGV